MFQWCFTPQVLVTDTVSVKGFCVISVLVSVLVTTSVITPLVNLLLPTSSLGAESPNEFDYIGCPHHSTCSLRMKKYQKQPLRGLSDCSPNYWWLIRVSLVVAFVFVA